MANLFIIGNGFDLAHGIKSTYENFHMYLNEKFGFEQKIKWNLPHIYPNKKDCNEMDAAKLIMRLINMADKSGGEWRDFENSLGQLDYSRFFHSYDMETFIDMTKNSLEVSIPKIKNFFANWVRTIRIDNVQKINTFANLIDTENDYFISFNYTHLLEEIYGVKNICHVHGDIQNEIIMGHGDCSKIKLVLKKASLINNRV